MVQLNALTASPANLAADDIIALFDASSGYLTQVTLANLLKPTCGMITATGTTTNLGAIGNTWTKVTAFDAISGLGAGTTESHSNDQITITKPYLCLVMYSVSMNNATGSRQLGARLAKDGVAIAGTYGHEVTTAANSVGSISSQALVSLAATDVITLEVSIPAGTSTGNVIINEANITIVPISPAA